MQTLAGCGVALIVLACGIHASAQAGNPFADQSEAMKGLRYIAVVVEDIPELRNVLTADALKAELELRLRQNGVSIPDEKDGASSIFPYLYLNLNVLDSPNSELLVYSMGLEFNRYLILPENSENQRYVRGSTWNCGKVGRGSKGRTELLKSGVQECMTEFLNEYLKANPKR